MPEWLMTGIACGAAYTILDCIFSYLETKKIKKNFRLIYEKQLQEFAEIMIRDRKEITLLIEELSPRLEALEKQEKENV